MLCIYIYLYYIYVHITADLVARGDEDVQGLEVAVERAVLVDVLQR